MSKSVTVPAAATVAAATVVKSHPIQVKATKLGYFQSLREPGDVFEVPDQKAVGKWMEVQNPDHKVYTPPPAHELPAKHGDSPTGAIKVI